MQPSSSSSLGTLTAAEMSSLRHLAAPRLRRNPAAGSSQSTHDSQNTTTTNTTNTSLTTVSSGLSQPLAAPLVQKRVRLAVNGRQRVPGNDSASLASTQVTDEDTEQSDMEVEDVPRKTGRGRKPLAPEEAARRIKERNRVRAANARKSQATELADSRAKAAKLEKEVEALQLRLGSLQRYVYDLEALVRNQNMSLPPRSPALTPSRALLVTDSFATDITEQTDATEATETDEVPPVAPAPASPTPAVAPVPTPSPSRITRLAAAPGATPPVSSSRPRPVSRQTRATATAVPLEATQSHSQILPPNRWSPGRRATSGAYTSPSRYTGPETPMSFVRGTESFTPMSHTSHTSHASHYSHNSHNSHNSYRTHGEPLAPTPATLEALQLQLKIQEFLASSVSAPGFQWPLPESTPASTEFTGGDDYDNMSLSAFFTFDGLEDDPEDANFEPTSPKHDSSDSEFEEDGDADGDGPPPRKRTRTSARGRGTRSRSRSAERERRSTSADADEEDGTPAFADDEEEDLFLPIEDVPIPPPMPPPAQKTVDDLYTETMESLGVSNRQEFTEVVTRLFTDANARRGGVSAQQMETLKRLMKIIEAQSMGAGP